MLALPLLLAVVVAQGDGGVVDSQRAEELMQPYADCVRGSALTLFILEIQSCDEQGDDSLSECAETATDRLRERTPPTHDECKRFIPTAAELLRDMA